MALARCWAFNDRRTRTAPLPHFHPWLRSFINSKQVGPLSLSLSLAASTMSSETPNFIFRGARLATMMVSQNCQSKSSYS